MKSFAGSGRRRSQEVREKIPRLAAWRNGFTVSGRGFKIYGSKELKVVNTNNDTYPA